MKAKFYPRHLIYVVLDLIITAGMILLSYLTFTLRSDPLTQAQINGIAIYITSVSAITVIVFFIFKIYEIVTSRCSLYDAMKIAAITVGIQIIGLIILFCVPNTYLPKPSVAAWVLSTLSITFLLTGLRLAIRGLNAVVNLRYVLAGERTIIIGCGGAAKIAFDESMNNRALHRKIVAFVDDDKKLWGGYYSGRPIVGPIKDIAKYVEEYKAEQVIIAIANLSVDKLHEIVELLKPLPVRIQRLPLLSEMNGPNDTRMINIDINDLLSRPIIKLDNTDTYKMLKDKVVLVTGAGGSIGSELVRQIFNAKPSKLVLFDIYENSLYDIEQDLKFRCRKENIKDIEIIAKVGSTYSEHTIDVLFNKYKPDYVYHAAAYKHVPLMEESPDEAIRTNVIGTYNVANACNKYKVKKMLLVSTDKAVRPTNAMGATKRFAELIIQYFGSISKDTTYCAVRFGNVLGSNGSVVPLFKKQLDQGGPLTVTDKDIIRYFMSIPEAVGLVLQCSLLANDGELFILDMGEPVKITSLAERMIRQAGYIPYKDIDIIFTGLRPGEKLYEELLLDKTVQKKTSNDRIYIETRDKVVDIVKEIEKVSKVFDMSDKYEIKKLLSNIIDTYTPDLKN